MGRQPLRKRLQVLFFATEVQLASQNPLELRQRRRRTVRLQFRYHVGQLGQPRHDLQVLADHLRNPRPLNLDGDRLAVGQQRTMDLANRRRGNGDGFK